MTDIEIARSINPKDITEVAKTLGIENKIELYGSNKAKISLDLLDKKRNNYILNKSECEPVSTKYKIISSLLYLYTNNQSGSI